MTVINCLNRYFVTYAALAVLAHFLFDSTDILDEFMVSLCVVALSVCWACTAFIQENQRPFERWERRAIWIGMSFASYAVHLFGMGFVVLNGGMSESELNSYLTLEFILATISCVLYIPVIWLCVWLVGRQRPQHINLSTKNPA